jgi:hypothetical protein
MVKFRAQRLAVQTVGPRIQAQHNVERPQPRPRMAECFTRQSLDQISIVRALQVPLRDHDTQTRSGLGIRSGRFDRAVMDHEMTTALRAP